MTSEAISLTDQQIQKQSHESSVNYHDWETIYTSEMFVTAKVTNIQPYGVFLEIQDQYKGSGLLHIKRIQNAFIPDLNEYFSIGDIIENVELEEVTSNRLSFSTVHLDLKKKLNSTKINSTDIETIKQLLMDKVGILSPAAEKEIDRSIKEHGLVTYVMAMTKALDEFNVDVSMLLVKEIEENIRGCL
ncbi:S1 RNA-binding domain-containing protein [Bacillus sp. 2SH]|uniref:S1 RNA-binding domain-containing protein n=1 Tax=Bacillus sp. 2SH TaxID=2502202 RepID=UPI0010F68EE9|nr:S1 RNA-binding domain-containing protein [Bacillus sp. 2SH]